ncbi:MAG TPA: hypothetical protein VKA84_01275 [Gemmatimonadaceae bacterium]|nr:hypothetical protein [Gemmatimonadaceae bacterium]
MLLLFLGSFLTGLLLGFYGMLYGVARPAAGTLRASLNVPLLGGFATAFGATGYLLTRYTALGAPARAVVAAAVGVAGALGAVALVTKWAIPSAANDVEDERYALQGHLARVTRAMGANSPGTIVYEEEGTTHEVRALALDDAPIAAGTEVVIERIEDGVAYVEAWSRVEERL